MIDISAHIAVPPQCFNPRPPLTWWRHSHLSSLAFRAVVWRLGALFVLAAHRPVPCFQLATSSQRAVVRQCPFERLRRYRCLACVANTVLDFKLAPGVLLTYSWSTEKTVSCTRIRSTGLFVTVLLLDDSWLPLGLRSGKFCSCFLPRL